MKEETSLPPDRTDASSAALPSALSYPGHNATPLDIQLLAEEYHRAADHLRELIGRRKPLSQAPFRLCAIHAIELYLNALLLHLGHEPERIRGLRHDLRKRSELAVASGLQLRVRTTRHLRTMDTNREYLVTRYGPELTTGLPQINRLAASLEEVATKVSKAIKKAS